MSTVIRSLMVKVGADLTNMQKGLKQASKDLESVGKSLTKTGTALTKSITLPVVAAATASIKYASDMEESLNKVKVAFGSNSQEIEDWSKTTLKNFGIAKGTALDMAALFGDMGTGMGMSQDAAAAMSEKLVGLAGDLASFKNISVDEASSALKGIFTGETESLKGLGVVMTEANLSAFALEKGLLKDSVASEDLEKAALKVETAQKKLSEATAKYGANSLEARTAQVALNDALENQETVSSGSMSALSEQEKVMLRYQYVMEKTANSQGDFSRTSDGLANQLRIAKESLKELAATIGKNLLPLVTPIIQKINEWIQKFADLDSGTQKMIIKIALVAVSIGPVLTVVGKLTTGIGGVVGGVSKAIGVIKGGGGIVSALGAIISPAGLVIAAVVAIAAAALLIYKNWDGISAFFKKLWNGVLGFFENAVNGIIKLINKIPGVEIGTVDWTSDTTSKTAANKKTTGITSRNKMAAYATGTNYVPETGYALLHKGEAVIPASKNNGYSNIQEIIYRFPDPLKVVGVNNEGEMVASAEYYLDGLNRKLRMGARH